MKRTPVPKFSLYPTLLGISWQTLVDRGIGAACNSQCCECKMSEPDGKGSVGTLLPGFAVKNLRIAQIPGEKKIQAFRVLGPLTKLLLECRSWPRVFRI
jgi:hypothetical protein